jgi:3-methyladenine DNA glycosylase AlkD
MGPRFVYDARMSTSWPSVILERTTRALTPLANDDEAPIMAAYMKGVAPFLGVRAGPRRQALRTAWRDVGSPTSDELGDACRSLMARREREYHYAAYDLIAHYAASADEDFLVDYVEGLLNTTPWWDTVDGLGTAAVSPLTMRYDASGLMLTWSASNDRWLIRAAIQHQRGRKKDTDVDFVLGLCATHVVQREFFIAKAIGWALRDIAAFDAPAVRSFLHQQPNLSPIAVREALRGLNR